MVARLFCLWDSPVPNQSSRYLRRSCSTIQSCPSGDRCSRAWIRRCKSSMSVCLSWDFVLNTTIPEWDFGGYARTLAKSKSRVINTRLSMQECSKRIKSSAPESFCSATVSASNPASRRIDTCSEGRFSSTLNFKSQLPRGVLPCPRALVPRHTLGLHRCRHRLAPGSSAIFHGEGHRRRCCQRPLKPSRACHEHMLFHGKWLD